MNENHVAGQLHQLRLKSNSDGYNTCIVVLDHLSKSLFDKGLDTGYRPTESMLKGSGKKIEILTSLLSINKLGLYQELVDQYKDMPVKELSDGKEWSMDDILKQLTIYEVIKSRNATCEAGNPVRFLADLGTMQFTDWQEMLPNTQSASLPEETETITQEPIQGTTTSVDLEDYTPPF